jgi:hypothetical protein
MKNLRVAGHSYKAFVSEANVKAFATLNLSTGVWNDVWFTLK